MTSVRGDAPDGRDLTCFDVDLRSAVADVLDRDPRMPQPGVDYPAWVTGCLGNPQANVWFIAENPSQTTALLAVGGATTEDQWNISDGDKLFRQTLVTYGFKSGGCDASGDWRCYLTDVVKSAYVVREWNAKTQAERKSVAESWASVLDREFELGNPCQLVTVGSRAERLLKHVMRAGLLPNLSPDVFTARDNVKHYTYLMNYPEGILPARHPDRIAAWQRRFAHIARD